jgi:hypothetical protein
VYFFFASILLVFLAEDCVVGMEMHMRIGQRPALEIIWIRDNKKVDEARYRVQVFGKDACVFDVRISLTAKDQAKPSPEEKIAEWFRRNPLGKPGTLEKIPDHHFVSQ